MAILGNKSFKGRGAQVNTSNRFSSESYAQAHIEGLDEPLLSNNATEFIAEHPKKIVNKVTNPDIPFPYSSNPYQGCEHGCIYCYARNTHEYWGYSAGLDFERVIIVKENAPELLENTLRKRSWKPAPIMLSGNTDCYQPIERKRKLTKRMLEILWKYRNPVGIITKNSLVLRDIDLLSKMAAEDLVRVSISVTTLDESLRQVLEPRTASGVQRLKTIERLSDAGIPVNVMISPLIPGLNLDEMVSIMNAATERGAVSATYALVRLSGSVKEIFTDWVNKTYPDRAKKVLHQIEEIQSGKHRNISPNNRRFGQGGQAQAIHDLFNITNAKLFADRKLPEFNLTAFSPPDSRRQLLLF